jgi:hypothetical protein
VVARAGFQPALSPAVFVRPNETTCRGNEGHRQAMRVAWARIQASGERMCLFEDDIEDTQGPCAGARYISKAIGKDPSLDIVYISGHKNFYRNHAQCISPDGAAALLHLTRDCHGAHALRDGESVDVPMAKACLRGKRHACMQKVKRLPNGSIDTEYGFVACGMRLDCLAGPSLFVQDRKHLTSYIHCTNKNCLDVPTAVAERPAARRAPEIFVHDGFYKRRRAFVPHDFRFDWCSAVDPSFPPLNCTLTWDARRMDEATAVFFHSPITKLQNGTSCDNLHRSRENQYWVWSTLEAPPLSNIPCARHFNVSMSFARGADIPFVYNAYQPRRNASAPSPAPLRSQKTHFALWIVSDCKTLSGREKLAQLMLKQMQIDVHGQCARHFGQRSPPNVTKDDQRSHLALRTLARRYLFYLAFENNLCQGYITEKAWHWGLEMGAIPVVYGGLSSSDYSTALPPNSFIDASGFRKVADLVAYLHRVATNESLFNSYHAWRRDWDLTLDFRLRWDFSKTQEQLGMCRLCDFLQRSVGGDGALRPRTLAPDFFAREKLCNRLVAFDSV